MLFDAGPAGAAFSRQSTVFDHLDENNKLSGHLRGIVRREVEAHLSPESHLLELNAGTGLDALYFASRGHHVFATDVAPGMIAQLQKKTEDQGLLSRVTGMQLSYHDLHQVPRTGFDHILSNFGGLNCTPDLRDVLRQLAGLLKPGGKVTLVIMPKVCPWELVMAFKGKFNTAFRRFKKRTPANVEGLPFFCYYYNPSYVLKHTRKEFNLISLKGIFITVPPEFYSRFVERYPRLYSAFSRFDRLVGGVFPFNRWCDHYMITLQKKT